MSQLSPRLQRLVAILILLALVALIHSFVISPIVAAYARYDAEIATSRDLLERYRRISGFRDDLHAQADDLRSRSEVRDVYLPGGSESMAAADLQQRIQAIARRAGATVASVQSLGSIGPDNERRVALRISMTADTEALKDVFYGIEHSRPFLVIDDVDIAARGQRSRRLRGGREVDDDAAVLTVRFDVFGYLRSAS